MGLGEEVELLVKALSMGLGEFSTERKLDLFEVFHVFYREGIMSALSRPSLRKLARRREEKDDEGCEACAC